jgi:hypothetical protein
MARILRRAIFAAVYRISEGSWRAGRLLDPCQMNLPDAQPSTASFANP